ncbi:MAG: DEAD/DEAH box helicase [Cyclobacteriaceae bacterium]|nr:DEAD/DEAH box helicase [Cyclobacteriaceae bacterium HetDA_MAG_MS6]
MKVAPERPFKLIYSLYQHEYLGYLFESFVVQLDAKGQLTFSHQNISSKNAKEFGSELDENDYELIQLMDSMQQEVVINHFVKKKIKPEQFFLKTYDKKVGDEVLQNEISKYLERRRSKILPLLAGKMLFEMGTDGEPAWRQITILEEKATILFHFRKNEDNTHYFPTIKLRGEKIDFRQESTYIVCNEPAWMVVDQQLVTFEKEISGGKIRPFLKKKFILIPKNVEETYYEKFVAPLVATFDVYAKGFDIVTEKYEPKPILTLSELEEVKHPAPSLFEEKKKEENRLQSKVLFELSFEYGKYQYKADHLRSVSVSLEKQNGDYTFHRISRNANRELSYIDELNQRGLNLKNSRLTLQQGEAFSWLNDYQSELKDKGFVIRQHANGGKRYFLGESVIDVQINENIDWFDIKATIRFGEYEIPFKTIRKLILQKKNEIKLPNGEIAIIPDSWLVEYGDLLSFTDESDESNVTLKKHHLALVQELKENHSAKVSMTRKLERLMDFQEIEEYKLPKGFKGELRPYQKAGFNWMQFLNNYNFGGCLANDMGLGKTVQTLAMLQHEVETNPGAPNLLVMPTSLIYNWEKEAKKFTSKIKVLNYTGTNRVKNPERFAKYDIVITSYGITRLDADVMENFYFNYIILDESQAIKNPDSLVSKAVRKLKSRRKLILSGTPIENSTLDLWSQISFINPGLLGTQRFFKNEYLNPIEKQQDLVKIKRLNTLIKPFILRRDKSQVAQDLPEKVVNVQYCDLSESQREYYEKEKNAYRNQILDLIEKDGLKNSAFIILQGLNRLRQIANHPKLIDGQYDGNSGKLEDITYMIQNALGKDHKILIFSQYVKHLKIIEEFLQKEHVEFAYLDGSVKDRQREVEKFQENDDVRVFLISLKAGGLGLNLTKADYVFILDPWWNPAVEAQAIDRAHRIGQKNKVFTYKFITRDTVEEKILTLQESKLKLAKDLITVEESFVKSLSQEDIKSLFD